ncbi:MAG: hypothetical protein QOD42_687 [Sphingomonadales bacterium]|jgi:hypothetical protein|nr:hypothetical protein [Sphingomonadales bacterium]
MSARRLIAVLLALAGVPAGAQTIVTSAGPERVAVTVYRDPRRGPERAPNLGWLDGFALISETRTVTLPAGEADVRFEGVAGGILPQSAIVTGFPDGVVERNRDAYLLSPATLLDRSLGRRVAIRRTSHATGAVVETEAVIRSSANGGIVVRTPAGVEALRCTGLPEGLVYDRVPLGLSARPTLSVRTRSAAPVTATVILSYLAGGFDWQANYIAQLSPDRTRVDLFAWLTLASSDETSFVDADTQAVAGQVNREEAEVPPSEGGPLNLQCWPQATTSDIPQEQFQRMAMRGFVGGEDIIVTGSRIPSPNLMSVSPVTAVSARQENLGDLKLYRIPEPVTVAANSQKQVALLTRPDVRIALLYRQTVMPEAAGEPPLPSTLVLTTHNRAADGLGLPLPAGNLALFGERGGRPLLLGEGTMWDQAVGQDVEIELGDVPGITGQIALTGEDRRWRRYRLTVTNDRDMPVSYQASLFEYPENMRFSGRLGRWRGWPLWAVTIPANSSVTLDYRVKRDPPRRVSPPPRGTRAGP